MNHLNHHAVPRRRCVHAVTMLALVTAALSAPAIAQKSKFKYTKPLGTRQVLSSNVMTPGDRPGHELAQYVFLDRFHTSDREYNGTISYVYDQEDNTAGTGTHRGTSVDVLANGDKVFWKFEGRHETVIKPDGTWEMTCSGQANITGGTGKYAKAKGTSPYRCKATPEGYFEEGEQDWEY